MIAVGWLVVLFYRIKTVLAGLHAAARDLDMEWVVIKGVSDFADGKKSDTDAWRPYHASVMAASLTVHILSNPIVFEHVPHYEGNCYNSPHSRSYKGNGY